MSPNSVRDIKIISEMNMSSGLAFKKNKRHIPYLDQRTPQSSKHNFCLAH